MTDHNDMAGMPVQEGEHTEATRGVALAPEDKTAKSMASTRVPCPICGKSGHPGLAVARGRRGETVMVRCQNCHGSGVINVTGDGHQELRK